MQILNVIMNQQHLEPWRLPGKTVVVLDVLFATTTIAMALSAGATDVMPVAEVDEARKQSTPDALLAGEKDAMVPEGFLSFSPTLLSQQSLAGRRLVLVTTNGTVALENSKGAAHIYTAALVNTGAIVRQLLSAHTHGTILLVCSASRHRFNIEDFIGAGVIVERLLEAAPERFYPTDAAIAARTVASGVDIRQALYDSRVGRMMSEMNLEADVELACGIDRYDVVPKLQGDSLVGV